MMCSNSIEVVGKFAKENRHSYSYNIFVEVIPLAMVDDLIAAANSSMDSVEINTFVKTLI